MAKNCTYTVGYRRKREGRTNYKKRLNLLKGNIPRLVIRKTNTEITIQITKYFEDGDKVIATFVSKKLDSFGWKYSKKSIPASYLAGLALGKLSLEKGIKEAVLDLGLQSALKGSKLYAVLKGVVDAGVKIPVDESVFPSEDRLNGTHITKMTSIEASFTKYKKNNLDISKIPETFEVVKKKIMG